MNESRLEHLAPYLPYGLKGFATDIKLVGDITFQNIEFVISEQPKTLPILRPMSDLSMRYGEDVINEHSINMLLGKDGNYGDVTVSQWKESFDIEIELGYYAPSVKSIDFKIMIVIMNELYRGHFDVFDLIDQGFAIDINTIPVNETTD